ncbi:MAG: ABC transporter permease subunit [Polyangiaceae bacterium]|nr:ABC transporter permease subunit [Polyangiaceae bacterium]
MVVYGVRRALWLLPTLAFVSLATFLFLSYVPDPAVEGGVAAAQLGDARVAELRRRRFLDLPRFANTAPADARARAAAAVQAIVNGGNDEADARRELVRLGGAALPHVIPGLDALAPEPRSRVALALAPLAKRMGLTARDETTNPERAAAFWIRFWNDREPEFRDAAVRSTVRRLSQYGAGTRAGDLRALDTFVFEHVIAALAPPTDSTSLASARALVDILADVTERDDRIGVNADMRSARACVDRWLAFDAVYGTDFKTLTGAARITAVGTETRYGKWLLFTFSPRVAKTAEGTPVLTSMGRRARVSLPIVFGAIALAYSIAIPLGVVAAATRRRVMDLGVVTFVLALYALPTAVISVLVANIGGTGSLVVPTMILALSLVAAPAGQQRAALLGALYADHIVAARARGAGLLRVVLVHGLRHAIVPTATLTALEAPMALGGAFVVERVFSLYGLGEATIVAVEQRDIPWLMALSFFAAAAAAIGVFLTDMVYAVADPRGAAGVLDNRRRA